MTTSDVKGDQIFHDNVTFSGTISVPAGSFDTDDISTDANKRIADTKIVHRPDMNYAQANGSAVVSATQLLRVCRGAGELLGFEVRPTTIPTGGDLQYTVDIQKASNASSSWSSLLSAVVTVDSADANDTLITATLAATPTTADGDALRIVVTTSGTTGTQGQGFVATAVYKEQSA